MAIKTVAKTIGNFTTRNSQYILSGVAVAGVASTAAFTVKGTLKAKEDVDAVNDHRRVICSHTGEEYRVATKKEIVKISWKHYIPAAVSGALTIGAIVGSTVISHKKLGALAAAYGVAQSTLGVLESKIASMDDNTKKEISEAVGQTLLGNKDKDGKVKYQDDPNYELNNEEAWFYEPITNTKWVSTINDIEKAQNNVNQYLLRNQECPMDYVFDWLGIEECGFSNMSYFELSDNMDQLEISYIAGGDNDGKPCYVIGFNKKIQIYGQFDRDW